MLNNRGFDSLYVLHAPQAGSEEVFTRVVINVQRKDFGWKFTDDQNICYKYWLLTR